MIRKQDLAGITLTTTVSRFSNGGSTAGLGAFLGSFAITQTGDVHLVTAVPEVNSAFLVGLASLAGLVARRRQASTGVSA
jgi:MYXO-CTERM domain-containing protein